MTYISDEIRRLVSERAKHCCEYCLMPQAEKFFPFEIDHIIALKHEGETALDNLCLACPDCNLFKGSDVSSTDPISGEIVPLFHPRRQHWEVHFELEGSYIAPLSANGRVTVKLLKFNHPERVEERAEMLEMGVYPPLALD